MTQTSPLGTFNLTEYQRVWLQRRALQSAPEEACGFIFADGAIKEIRNIDPYPYKGFKMCPNQLGQINPKDIVAIWHTHPSGRISLSDIDQIQMTALGEAYGSWAYIVATKDEVAVHNTVTDWSKFV